MLHANWLGRLLTDALGALLAPPRCAACDEPIRSRAAFCRACAASIEAADDGSGAAFCYGGAVARAICRLKFEKRAELAGVLWPFLLPLSMSISPAAALVLPVPLHPERLRERGFNQAALLARPLATALGARFAPGCIERCRNTRPQVGLSRAARTANVRGVFAARSPEAVRGRIILLVDDVRSTGATIAECSHALIGAGARHVHAITLARAEA